MQFDICQHRALELFEQRSHLFVHLVRAANVSECSPAEPCRVAHEVRVRRRADSDREQPAAAEVRADEGEELLLVTDLAIGHEDDLADDAIVRRWIAKCRFEGRHHLRPAERNCAVEISLQIFRLRPDRDARFFHGVRRDAAVDPAVGTGVDLAVHERGLA